MADLRPRVRRMASICTGSFILAQTGMLDGRRATTHWRHTGLLSRAYPRISVEPDAIFVRDGDIYTSAGVSAGIDLALALVESDHGADLVREVARSLVVYLKRAGGQSQFSALVEAQPPRRSQLRELTEAIAANPGANHTVKTLAAQASLSSRQLTRLFHAELGTTPARYVEMIRIDCARSALDAGRSVGTRRDWQASEAPRLCAGYSSGNSASRRRRTATDSSRPAEPLQLFQRGAFDVIAEQLSVLAHCPYRRPRHRDGLLIGRCACEAVVPPGQHPAGGDAAAVGVLERLEDLKTQSLIFSRKPAIHRLKLSRPVTASPPVTMTKSSTTNRSAAAGSWAFHTSSQKACTISTEFGVSCRVQRFTQRRQSAVHRIGCGGHHTRIPEVAVDQRLGIVHLRGTPAAASSSA